MTLKAKRDKTLPPYYLIPACSIEELAKRFEKGMHYGRENWKYADMEFREDAFSHAVEHLWKFNEKDTTEDTQIENLAAVMWFCATEIWHLKQDIHNPA